MGVVKYNSDWIDRLHPGEATVYVPYLEEREELRHEDEVWGGNVPYRDSINTYAMLHERMAEKYGPFMWAVGT